MGSAGDVNVNLSAEAGWPGPWGPWGPHPHGPWGPHWHRWGPHRFGPHWHHPHWEALAKQDHLTENAGEADVSLSAEAGWPGPWGPHPHGPWGPHWHHWGPHHFGPHWHHHPHWEVLARQENSTENAGEADVNLSAEAGWPGPWGPHPHAPLGTTSLWSSLASSSALGGAGQAGELDRERR